jgi:hypothetical protein
VGNADIANNAIGTAKINDGGVRSQDIQDGGSGDTGGVASVDIQDGSVGLVDVNFIKKVSRLGEGEIGFNPHATAFTILDEQVDINSAIIVTIDNNIETLCGVYDITEYGGTDFFSVKCAEGNVEDGAAINYVIIGPD